MSTDGYTHKWNRLNHDMGGGTIGGYALCANCGCLENSDYAAEPCAKGPAVRVRTEVCAKVADAHKSILHDGPEAIAVAIRDLLGPPAEEPKDER